jgi:hypothetical protein
MSNSFLVGSYLKIQAAFRNSAGTLVDPTTVVLKVTTPTGGTSNPALTHPSVGVYYCNYTLVGAPAGVYIYKFTGSGAAIAVNEGTFTAVATAS